MPGPRPYLRFSLRTFLVVTLALSVVLGVFGRIWLKAYRDSQPPTLHELAQIAKRHGIPMPPKGAKLVLARTGVRYANHRSQLLYSPVFLLQEENGDIDVLCGIDERKLSHDSNLLESGAMPVCPLCREFSLNEEPSPKDRYLIDWRDESALITAIQLAERGERTLAAGLLQRFVATRLAEGFETPDLREIVREIAFRQILGQLVGTPTRWPEMRTRISLVLEESPQLRKDYTPLLRDLSAAIDARPPAPDSVEALLIEWSRSEERAMDKDLSAQELAQRGFDAVPELIRLCGDQRFTRRARMEHFPDVGDGFLRLGDLADVLLLAISGLDDGLVNSVEMPDELVERNARVWQEWWRQAQVLGEREYCFANLFIHFNGQIGMRDLPAQILVRKHPTSLTHAASEFVRRSDEPVDRARLAAAIQRAELDWTIKLAMLTDLAATGASAERCGVLWVSSQLERPQRRELLTKMLDDLTADATDFDAATQQESFSQLVISLDEPAVLKALVRAARRNFELRMELLTRTAFWYPPETREPTRLAILQCFLADGTVRDRSLIREDFFPTDFEGITVRDFAAMHIARLLEIDDEPTQNWSPERWSTLREKVRQRLKQEQLPELE
jgi:hypothetical protein